MEIVTGSTGEVHVTPIDDAVRNSNVGYLSDKVVFTCFRNFEATAITNNEVRIYSGYGMNQGRIFKIDDDEWDTVTIENGSQGYKRADLIVARYTMNTQTGFEDISLVAIRGNSGSSYVDPTYSTGNINDGATTDDFPLYRVRLNGLTIEGLDRLFTLVPDGGRLGELEGKYNAHKTAFDALNVRTNLASESNVFLKNGANARPGVEGILPANHGGTGKTTLKDSANGFIGALDTDSLTPSNADYYIGTTPNTQGFQRKPLSALWEWLSNKISNLGYGDMVKAFFCDNPDSEVPTIKISRGGTGATTVAGARNALKLGNTDGPVPVANGGTGTNDGTLNGVKLATSGNNKGYVDANGNFRSFRQPTGTATAAQVLDGVYFANASSDSIRGTMPNRGAVNTSVNNSSASWTVPIAAGYHNGSGKVTVQVTAEKAVTATTSQQTIYGNSVTGGTEFLGRVVVNPQQHTGTYGTYLVPAGSGSTIPDRYLDQMSKTYLVDIGGAVHNNRYFRFELSPAFQEVVTLWGEQIVAPNAINYVGDSVSTSYYSSNTNPVATSALTYTCTKRGPVVIIGSSSSQLIDNMTITVRGSGRVLDNQYTIANTKVRIVYNCLNGTTLTLNADSKRTNVRIIQLYNSAIPT